MEYFSYLERIGDVIREERKRLGFNQVEFYRYLFPNENKEDENIKKYIHDIENQKRKFIDYKFLVTFCDKCEISFDYLFGVEKKFRNQENKLICEYTGLEEPVILQLHEWQNAKNYEFNEDRVPSHDEQVEIATKSSEKMEAIGLLEIINRLFDSNDKGDYSNLSVLYYLYILCHPNTKGVSNNPNLFDECNKVVSNFAYVNLNNGTTYNISEREIIEDIAKRRLEIAIREMINNINK